MQIHFIRHAKAKRHSISDKDFDRDLSQKGIKQALLLKAFLSDRLNGLEIWCSEANRTKQTLSNLLDNSNSNVIHYSDDLYLCSRETYLQKTWLSESNQDLVLIGHNFGISETLSYFTGEYIELSTCEYVCVEFDQLSRHETSNSTGVIIDRYRPIPSPS